MYVYKSVNRNLEKRVSLIDESLVDLSVLLILKKSVSLAYRFGRRAAICLDCIPLVR